MTRTFADLTGFQRDLLAATHLVERGPERPIGLEIQDVLEANGYEGLRSGRLYPALDTLVEADLLTEEPDPDDERANQYGLTDAGRDLLANYHQFLDRAVTGDPPEVMEA